VTIATAQTQAGGPTHCYLEVKSISDANRIQSIWETSWGSYDHNNFHRIVLNVRAGTVGRTGGPVKIRVCFVGTTLIDGHPVIYGTDEKPAVIPPAYFTEVNFASPELKNRILNLAAAGRSYVSGAVHSGWIVWVIDNQGRIVGGKVSSDALSRFIYDSNALATLPVAEAR
jgi:hypothetical protein